MGEVSDEMQVGGSGCHRPGTSNPWRFPRLLLHVNPTELRRVSRAAQDGRKLYRARGVLPWAAYNGPPPSQWWSDPVFADAIREWQLDALVKPSDEPQPDPERERKEMMARALGMDRIFARLREAIWKQKPNQRTLDAMASLRRSLRDRQLGEAGIEPWSFPTSPAVAEAPRPPAR